MPGVRFQQETGHARRPRRIADLRSAEAIGRTSGSGQDYKAAVRKIPGIARRRFVPRLCVGIPRDKAMKAWAVAMLLAATLAVCPEPAAEDGGAGRRLFRYVQLPAGRGVRADQPGGRQSADRVHFPLQRQREGHASSITSSRRPSSTTMISASPPEKSMESGSNSRARFRAAPAKPAMLKPIT